MNALFISRAHAWGIVSAIAIAVGGCASRGGGDTRMAQTALPAPDPVAQLDLTRQYRLGPGDTVEIRVFRAAEITGDYKLDDQGEIDLPLVGRVAALGSTPEELSNAIRRALGATYYVNPQVGVSIKEALGRRVTIDGSVRSPGIYPVDYQTTLLRAITLASGTTEYANTRRVVVFRTIDGQRQAAAFDLKAIREGRASDPQIYGSDIIVVDGNELRLALRDFLQAVPLLAIFNPF